MKPFKLELLYKEYLITITEGDNWYDFECDNVRGTWFKTTKKALARAKEMVDATIEAERSEQGKIINELTRKYYNTHLVTCGNCSAIFNELYETQIGLVVCPHCGTVWEPSDNPDLFY